MAVRASYWVRDWKKVIVNNRKVNLVRNALRKHLPAYEMEIRCDIAISAGEANSNNPKYEGYRAIDADKTIEIWIFQELPENLQAPGEGRLDCRMFLDPKMRPDLKHDPKARVWFRVETLDELAATCALNLKPESECT